MQKDAFDRLAEKFIVGDGCWEWISSIASGYGSFWLDGAHRCAHRVVYELLVGPIPEGLELDHQCHNDDETCPGGPTCPHRRCVNPAHLEPSTHAENGRRGRGGDHQRRKTHCPQGHAYTRANVYRLPSRPTARYCRACQRDRNRDRRRREREAAR